MKTQSKQSGNVFRVFVLVTFCMLLLACAAREPGMVRDLKMLPQDAAEFVTDEQTLLISEDGQMEMYQDFLMKFYSPWHRNNPKFDAEQVFWGLNRFKSRTIYGENNLPLPDGWLAEMKRTSDIDNYPSMHLRAITTSNASMRVLPTHRPLFYNPSQPGEGFPFDYLQNSLVPAGTPVLITHMSQDNQWVLAETDYAAGWMRWTEIATVDQDFMQIYENGSLAGFTVDETSVLTDKGLFLFEGRVGMSLPLKSETGLSAFYDVFAPVRDKNGDAHLVTVRIAKDKMSVMPFQPTQNKMASLLNAMMGQKYGWGGLYENRDCSALLKDFFSGFGIFLPRNSRQQAQAGYFIPMQGISAQAKMDLISEHGRPWLTILYMPGHVMLYIGHDAVLDEPVIYHSMWGLRTWRPFSANHGRWIIGRTVITSLQPGKEMRDIARPEGLLLERITGMVLVAY